MSRMMVEMVVSINAHLSLSNSKKVNKIVVNNDGGNSVPFCGKGEKEIRNRTQPLKVSLRGVLWP